MPQITEAIIIAIIQGITEWFPVSSSSHLILASKLLNFDNTLSFNVALHLGTLLAVFVYFSKDITNIVRDLINFRFKTPDGKLGILLILASVPALLVGYFFNNLIESTLSNLSLISLGLGITSLLLIMASLNYKNKNKGKLNSKTAILIGLAQSFSIFRGISRTGSTFSSGLILGLNEKTALKFSFLLSIPIVLGANVLTLTTNPLPKEFIWYSLISFAIGLPVLHLSYTKILSNRINLRYFAIYLLLLALVINFI
ncbi:MAG: undecaprenyl-diphosphate phosphatase [Nanoarchaeota archaeon]|nr:undecaprenyl-diphosphate phosphatase [Nanoarchaeota archaeon]